MHEANAWCSRSTDVFRIVCASQGRAARTFTGAYGFEPAQHGQCMLGARLSLQESSSVVRPKILAIGSFVALLGAGACGTSSTSTDATQAAIEKTNVATFQDLSSRVQSAAYSYGATMVAGSMTLGNCAAVHDAYDAQVRPWLSQMVQMSGTMDGYIDSHSGLTYADMHCVTSAMWDDLEAHRLAACKFATLSANQAEASRHVNVMTSYAAHAYDRCGQMMGGLDGHGYSWGPTAGGCGWTGPTGAPDGGPTGGSTGDPLSLGSRIFYRGIGANGQPIVRTGGYGMMMMSGCADCHGSGRTRPQHDDVHHAERHLRESHGSARDA